MIVLWVRGEAQSLASDNRGTQGFFLEQLVSPWVRHWEGREYRFTGPLQKTLSEEEPIRTVQKDSGLM